MRIFILTNCALPSIEDIENELRDPKQNKEDEV
jgi:hypothetical protein